MVFRLAFVLCGLTAGSVAGQAAFTGTVVDAGTGAPLPGAHVFIASSMLGTATDAAGRYRLEPVPPGAHRLYVSMLGFEPAHVDTLVVDARPYGVDFSLESAVLELGEVTVSARADGKWKKRLEKFTRLFLGESPNAAETRILNPEVLDFKASWWGKLEATAAAPLTIENRALGYRIQYFLKEFTASGGTIRYDGEPLFEPLTPASPEEAARWEANRRAAWYGSFRHFLLAALNGTAEAEGFLTYRIPSLDNPERSRLRFPLRMASVLREGPEPATRTLRFYGFIEVNYTREREDPAYLRWQGAAHRRSPGDQRSWLRLTDGPTTLDETGTVLDPYGVTVYGYFAFERAADELPKEYRPGGAPEP